MTNTKRIILVAIIVVGGIFRFYHVNWDNFGAFHPDERNISWAVTRIHFFDQLNPKFFAYGGLPIYLYRALAEGVAAVTHNQVWLNDWGHIAVVGRSVSAVLSTVSIGLIFIAGALYFSPGVGLLSAALLAFSPWAFREAHFETTETMLVFFLLLLVILSKKIGSKKTHLTTFLLGFVWGLALAAKTTSLVFAIIPLAALLSHKKFWDTVILSLVAGITFFVFSPFTILDFTHFYESMTYESGVALGRFTVPYTLQFLHTPQYIYQIITMLWQSGLVVIAGLVGFVCMVLRLKKYWLFLLFPLLYFGWIGTWFAKFSRYNVPFLPFATIAAAWLSVALIKKTHTAGYLLAGILIVTTALWGFANFTVFMRPQTRIAATTWIFQNIPDGATIYTEHWNDGLPLDYPNAPSYNRQLLTVYDEPDDNTKRLYYADMLSAGDYVILSTRRIWATMPRLTQKYPVTSNFYAGLLNGTLGYTEVATFSSYPQLLSYQVNDDSAEESVAVFDHPTVRIFKNTSHLTKNALLSVL